MQTNQLPKAYKFLGSNDDESTCSLCGREELKSVVWLESVETGEVFHVGRDCGAKLLKVTMPEFKAFEKSEVERMRNEAREFRRSHPATIALNSEVNRLNSLNLMGKSRMEILKPFIIAENEMVSEIKRLWPSVTCSL